MKLYSIHFALQNNNTNYQFERDNVKNLDIKTNTKTNLEVAARLNNQLVSLKVPLEQDTPKDNEIQTNGYNLDYLYSFRRYLFDFQYQNYQGHNTNDLDNKIKTGRIDIQSQTFSFQWSYFFNEDFIFEDSYLPLLKTTNPTSINSWVLTNSITRREIKSKQPFVLDSSFISNPVINEIADADDLIFSTIIVRGGYYYLTPFYKNFIFSGLFTIGLGNQILRADDKIFNHGVNSNDLELSLGYKYKNYIFGGSFENQAVNTSLEKDSFKVFNSSIKFFYHIKLGSN